MIPSWTLSVGRDDSANTELTGATAPDVGDGQALLRVDRVGVTANNVTYAMVGESFHYWDFFPAAPGRGVVPLWGFAEVIDSAADGVEVGARVFGYLPSAGHLLVEPERSGVRGFRDASPHRAQLPSAYNSYDLTAGDPSYDADREDLQILYRPLFLTSFMLADLLADNDGFGAEVVVASSASSKTAYGTAFLLRDSGPTVIGLTSPGNVAFTESLGCYDHVLTYDAVAELSADLPTAYLDIAGNSPLSRALHEHLGPALVHHAVIGLTHQDASPIGTLTGTSTGTLTGARPKTFFAPDQMRKRTGDWGREGLDDRFGAAWRSFAPVVEGWVDVVVGQGPRALEQAWLDVLSGTCPPRTGHVLAL